MKKCLLILMMLTLLTGCGAQQTFETLSDEYVQSVGAAVQQLKLELPEDASVMTLENQDTGRLYLCSGYTVSVQTMDAGDLEDTIRTTTGFSSDHLQILQTSTGNVDRYECVWVAAGESGSQVCRATILDDGNYHYAVTIIADSAAAGQFSNEWQGIMRSIVLSKV